MKLATQSLIKLCKTAFPFIRPIIFNKRSVRSSLPELNLLTRYIPNKELDKQIKTSLKRDLKGVHILWAPLGVGKMTAVYDAVNDPYGELVLEY
jgi:hypothetical protein